MTPMVVAERVGKTFRRFHADRPASIQEAVAKGLRRLRAVERHWALRDVSFTVAAGKTVGIIGANGSGKSTLLRLIGGVGRPDTGRIEVHGSIGALLDLGAGFHPELTGRENALLAGILNGLTRREALDRLDAIVAFAEVERALDHPMRTYSSGMQMRLAFSVAVHTDPDILLIDEVLSVGDIAFQRKCMDRIAEFRARGCSILLVTHEGSVVQDLCDEAVWLSAGRLMMHGAAADVVREYAAHMGASEPVPAEPIAPAPAHEPEQAPPIDGDASYPVISPPPETVRTVDGVEVPIDPQRFGSRELEIDAVRLLDADARPMTDAPTGASVHVEVDYLAVTRVVAPIFYARITRDDGLLVYDLNTEFSPLSLSALHGPGSITLHIERFDLNTGRYNIEIGCYAQGWAYCYDVRVSACVLAIRGDSIPEAVLNVPHRWEFTAGGPVPLSAAVESGAGSSSQ